MKGVIAVFVVSLALVGCLKKELSPEDSKLISELRTELVSTRASLVEAQAEDAIYAGGLIKALIGIRLQVLKTNEALIQQRINAIESGAEIKTSISSFQPDPVAAAALQAEIDREIMELAVARAEAARYTGGLVAALKMSAVATKEQSLALLKQRFLSAKYGLSVGVPSAEPVAASTTNPVGDSIPREEIKACATTPSASERSACYDALAQKSGFTLEAETPVEGAAEGRWITSASIDPLTDKGVYTATLIATSGKTRMANTPTLTVRCKDNSTEMYINWDDYLGSDAYTTSRVGQEKATTSNWTLSTDKKAAFYPGSPVGMLLRVINAESFVANITPYNESPITAVFETKGAAPALADIRKGCGW